VRDGRPLGRIAGIINETHNKHHADATGFFGFFDFVNDLQVAQRLFQAAEREVRSVGKTVIRGPYSPTQNDECGLLVAGFDDLPFIKMPYNPQYYVDTYCALNLHGARDLYAFHATLDTQPSDRIKRAAERMRRKTAITVRGVERRHAKAEMRIVQELFNETLDKEWSFMPLTVEDIDYAVREFKAILDPDLMLVAEAEGKPVGFSVTVPNVNEFMARARGSRGLLRLLKLAWYVGTRRPRELRLAMLGVDAKYQAKGVAPAFYLETLDRSRKKYVGCEISWVQDVNSEIIKAIELMGGRKTKTYRIYEKAL
jgi:GNAT superfamily N-acetyltransferase